MAMQFSVQPDYEDYRAANWLTFRRAWLSVGILKGWAVGTGILFTLIFAQSCLQCGFSWNLAVRDLQSAVTSSTLGLVGFGVFCAALTALQIRKTYDQLGTVDQKVEYIFGDDGFEAFCDTGSSNFKWRHLSDFLRSDRLIIIRRTAAMLFLIPTSQLDPGAADALVDRLTTGGLKRR